MRLMLSSIPQEAVQSAIMKGPQATVELPSGEQVPVKSLVIPPVKGRKVVLLGDTCDSHAILSAPLSPPSCCSRAFLWVECHVACSISHEAGSQKQLAVSKDAYAISSVTHATCRTHSIHHSHSAQHYTLAFALHTSACLTKAACPLAVMDAPSGLPDLSTMGQSYVSEFKPLLMKLVK